MGIPKYLIKKETGKDMSNKQENKVRKQLASGALWFAKGDITTDTHMIECKTGRKQVTITGKILKKIYKEAWKEGKLPGMVIEIGEYTLSGMVFKEKGR